MKFKKTAIAAIVASFAAAPMMASADTVLSGVAQVKFNGKESDDDASQEDLSIAAGDVRAAIATEHELNSGLIGYGNLQLNLDDLTGEGGIQQEIGQVQVDTADPDGSITDADPVELDSAATVSSDNVYVGIKGDFGDVRLGEIPLAVEYGQLANDIHDVGTTVPGGLSYTGTFGPVGFGLNYSPEPDSDMIGAGVKFNFAGATIGLGFEDRVDNTNFSAGASYAIGGFSIAAHAWSKGQIDFETDDNDDTTTVMLNQSLDDQTAVAVQVGYGIGAVSLGFTFSQQTTQAGVRLDGTGAPIADDDTTTAVASVNTDEVAQQIIRFDAGYDLGGGMDVSTRIQNTSDDVDGSDDVLEYRVMLSKSF